MPGEAGFADAIAKLEADHDKVEALFEQIERADPASKRKLGAQVCNMLKIHMALEEELLYPALRGKAEDDKLNEGLVEHDAGKLLLNDILSDTNGDDILGPKLQVLGEQMVHHHKEEEEDGDGVFAEARKSGLDLVAMLERMNARENQLKTELAEDDLPTSEMNFVHVSASES